MIKILVVDQTGRSSSNSRLLNLLSDKEYRCYFLNNTASLTDDLFLSSFDVVIINSLKNNILNDFPKGEHKVILLVGTNETYLLPYVPIYIPSFRGIVKKGNLHELMTSISVAMNDGCYMSQGIKEALFPRKNNLIRKSKPEYSTKILTRMELRVAEELITDKTNQEIADNLFISKRTVEYHIASCIQKLNANSRVGLAIKIARVNLLIG